MCEEMGVKKVPFGHTLDAHIHGDASDVPLQLMRGFRSIYLCSALHRPLSYELNTYYCNTAWGMKVLTRDCYLRVYHTFISGSLSFADNCVFYCDGTQILSQGWPLSLKESAFTRFHSRQRHVPISSP